MDLFNVYTKQVVTFVYRVFDPVAGRYCQSAGSRIGNTTRSVWTTHSGAVQARNHLPEEVRSRAVIKKFRLNEVEE